MSDTIGAYWAVRPVEVDRAAELLAETFTLLSEADPRLSTWYAKGPSQPTADDEMSQDVLDLAERLRRGRNRRDIDHTVIEGLGYRVAGWNGQEFAAEFSLQVGVTSHQLGISNSVVLRVPEDSRIRAEAPRILRSLVELWDAERAVWMTKQYRRNQVELPQGVIVGWQTYLSGVMALRTLDLPPGAKSEAFADGVLIEAGVAPGDESVAIAAKVAESLLAD